MAQILARLSRRPLEAVVPESHLLLDLGLDSLAKLALISEIERATGLHVGQERAMTLTWVSDVMGLARSEARPPV